MYQNMIKKVLCLQNTAFIASGCRIKSANPENTKTALGRKGAEAKQQKRKNDHPAELKLVKNNKLKYKKRINI